MSRIDKKNNPALKSIIVAMSVCLVVGLGFIDYYSGYLLALDILYLVPVSVATWVTGAFWGGTIALFSTAAWTIGTWSLSAYHAHEMVAGWNILSRLLIFWAFVFLLSSLKKRMGLYEELAHLDPLTRIPNRRAFYNAIVAEKNRCEHYSAPFTIAYMDVDNFKSINDTLGHKAGDELLVKIASVLKSFTRKSDMVARVGGDEMVLLLPETNNENARQALQKLRMRLDEITVQGVPVTFSIGVATFNKPPVSYDEILMIVDNVMFRVKNQGKNNVRFISFPEDEILVGRPKT